MPPRLIATIAAVLLSAITATPASARLPTDPIPPFTEDFPACSVTRTAYCIEEFSVDLAGTGTFTAPPVGVSVRVILTQALLPHDTLVVIGVKPAFQYDLAPELPAGTAVRIRINTGAVEPAPLLTEAADGIRWTRALDDTSGWSTTIEARTIASTSALHCGTAEGDGCDNPTDLVDYASRLSFQTTGPDYSQFDSLTPELKQYNRQIWQQLTGGFFTTSAPASGFPPVVDVYRGTVSFSLGAPHLTAASAPNIGLVSAFVPDAAVIGYWGGDPDLLAAPGALVVTRKDGDTTSAVPNLTITHADGGLHFFLTGIHFSAPTFSLRARRLLKPPATISATAGKRRITVTFGRVRYATAYEAACTRGLKTVVARGKKRTIVVKGLARGRWTCHARGVGALGLRWSDSVRARVRR